MALGVAVSVGGYGEDQALDRSGWPAVHGWCALPEYARRVSRGRTLADSSLPEIDFGDIGPRIGERFPDVRLPDQHGNLVDLHDLRGTRRAVVLFYLSADW